MKIGNPADKALGGVSPRAEGTASGVSSAKQSIEQGTYKVNPQVIADKLISNARDLLPSR
jgi:anti-sigma28 factor (negative regulator of flagellin synthesis)